MTGSQIEGVGVSPWSEVNLNSVDLFSPLLRNWEHLQNVVESALSKISRENLLGVQVDWEASWEGGSKDVGGGAEEGGGDKEEEEDDQQRCKKQFEWHSCKVGP